MKELTIDKFSALYLEALRAYLKKKSSSGEAGPPARELGLQAITMDLAVLALSKVHEEALVQLLLPLDSAAATEEVIRRAGLFFAEAVTPIEESHRDAADANAKLKELVAALSERTAELAESNDKLTGEVKERKDAEGALKVSQLTSSQLLVKSRQMQEELRHLSRRLLSVQEDERKRISRELHDVIAQSLTSINVRLAALTVQTETNAKDIQKKIAVAQRLVEKSMEIVHRFASDLRPAALDDLGLVPALRSHFKSFEQQTTVKVEFHAAPGVEALDIAVRTALYRVVQEALTNVARHAQASLVKVSIEELTKSIRLEITDNGHGFSVDAAAAEETTKTKGRLGLLSMRERTEMVGGAFTIESAPGQATTIRVDVPRKKL